MKSSESGNLPPRVSGPIPGRLSQGFARRLAEVESRNITYRSHDFPIFWRRAKGSNVWDPDGNRYVDLTGGFGVAAAGHGNRRIAAAVRAQLTRQMHGMGDVHPPVMKVRLLEELSRRVPVDSPRTVLANSGSEAVEAALKTARLATGKPGVLAFEGAYHGLTYGSLALTDRELFRAPFADQLGVDVVRVPFPTGLESGVSTVKKALDTDDGRDVGAVVVEPIQGRGGIVEPPTGFLPALAELCRSRGIVLVFDEIFTGLGRTGAWFAANHEDVEPDIVCVGKALSGSLPIAACVGSAEVMSAWPESTGEAIHTSTFLGNPLACAAATASLLEVERLQLPARAATVGEIWKAELEEMAGQHPSIRSVRGRGLLLGLELVDPDTGLPASDLAGRVIVGALERGWILLASGPASSVISLSPPLTISEELTNRATGLLDELIGS